MRYSPLSALPSPKRRRFESSAKDQLALLTSSPVSPLLVISPIQPPLLGYDGSRMVRPIRPRSPSYRTDSLTSTQVRPGRRHYRRRKPRDHSQRGAVSQFELPLRHAAVVEQVLVHSFLSPEKGGFADFHLSSLLIPRSFTSGYIEVNLSLPGEPTAQGYWPGTVTPSPFLSSQLTISPRRCLDDGQPWPRRLRSFGRRHVALLVQHVRCRNASQPDVPQRHLPFVGQDVRVE